MIDRDVCFGSEADVDALSCEVRYGSEADVGIDISVVSLRPQADIVHSLAVSPLTPIHANFSPVAIFTRENLTRSSSL